MSVSCSHKRLSLRCWSRSWECQLVSGSCSHERLRLRCWSLSRVSQLLPKLRSNKTQCHQYVRCRVGSAHTNLYHPPLLPSWPFQQMGRTKQEKCRLRLPSQLHSPSYRALAASLLVAMLLHDLERQLHDTAARFLSLLLYQPQRPSSHLHWR